MTAQSNSALAASLFLDYLKRMVKDSSLAQIFQKRTNALTLSKGSPSIIDVIAHYQKTCQNKLALKCEQQKKVSSSDTSSESEDETLQTKVSKVPFKIDVSGHANKRRNPDSSSEKTESEDERTEPTKGRSVTANVKQPTLEKFSRNKEEDSSENSSSEEERLIIRMPHIAKTRQKLAPAIFNQRKTSMAIPSKNESSDEESESDDEIPTKSKSTGIKSQTKAVNPKIQESKSVIKIINLKKQESNEETSSEEDTGAMKVPLKRSAKTTPIPVVGKLSSSSEEESSNDETPPQTRAPLSASRGVNKKDAMTSSEESSSSKEEMDISTAKEEPQSAKKIIPLKMPQKKESSSDESDSEEQTKSTAKKKTSIVPLKKNPTLLNAKKESSGEDSSSDEAPSTVVSIQKPQVTPMKEDSDEDNSDDDETMAMTTPVNNAKRTRVQGSSKGTPAPASFKKNMTCIAGNDSGSDEDTSDNEIPAVTPLKSSVTSVVKTNKMKLHDSGENSDDSEEDVRKVTKTTVSNVTKYTPQKTAESSLEKVKKDEIEKSSEAKTNQRSQMNGFKRKWQNDNSEPTVKQNKYSKFVKGSHDLKKTNQQNKDDSARNRSFGFKSKFNSPGRDYKKSFNWPPSNREGGDNFRKNVGRDSVEQVGKKLYFKGGDRNSGGFNNFCGKQERNSGGGGGFSRNGVGNLNRGGSHRGGFGNRSGGRGGFNNDRQIFRNNSFNKSSNCNDERKPMNKKIKFDD